MTSINSLFGVVNGPQTQFLPPQPPTVITPRPNPVDSLFGKKQEIYPSNPPQIANNNNVPRGPTIGEQTNKMQSTNATPVINSANNPPKQYSNFRNLFGNISDSTADVNNNMNNYNSPIEQNGILLPKSNNLLHTTTSPPIISPMMPMGPTNTIQPNPVNIPSNTPNLMNNISNFPPPSVNQPSFQPNFSNGTQTNDGWNNQINNVFDFPEFTSTPILPSNPPHSLPTFTFEPFSSNPSPVNSLPPASLPTPNQLQSTPQPTPQPLPQSIQPLPQSQPITQPLSQPIAPQMSPVLSSTTPSIISPLPSFSPNTSPIASTPSVPSSNSPNVPVVPNTNYTNNNNNNPGNVTTPQPSINSNSNNNNNNNGSIASLDPTLMRIFNQLLAAERYKEAADCKTQIELLSDISKKTPLHQQAKFEQNFVVSLQLREEIESLQKKLFSQQAVEKWTLPPPSTHLTYSEMQKILELEAGKPIATQFVQEFSGKVGKSLREGDIKTLIELQDAATKKFAILRTQEPLITPTVIQRWETTTSKITGELKEGLEMLKKLNQQLREFDNGKCKLELQFFQSPKAIGYIKGLEEIFKLLKRFNATVNHFAKTQNVPAANFHTFFVDGNAYWREISSLLSELQISVVNEIPEVIITKEKFKGGVCELCLLPLSSYIDLPSLKWAGFQYHASCANFYCNRISDTPPVVR